MEQPIINDITKDLRRGDKIRTELPNIGEVTFLRYVPGSSGQRFLIEEYTPGVEYYFLDFEFISRPGVSEPEKQEEREEKLKIRDQFAMAAMQGMLSSVNYKEGDLDNEWISKASYRCADQMLKERSKPVEL